MMIREATDTDFDAIWAIFEPIVRIGDTYAFPSDCDRKTAHRLWMEVPRATYVAEEDGTVLGTYYIKANAMGPGAHVCNCGYMTSAHARGRGLATAMCEHSQAEAVRLGFKAMQYNSVISTNRGAIRLWQKLGFKIVGTLPKAFNHPREGFVDAFVMYKWLA